jgi:6-pyruvoyltetrahydropterin/6-carboxytetrahydropterin synthase
MYRAGVTRSYTARHALRGDFGEESVPHSHPYVVEWVCETGALDDNGFSVNIAAVEAALEAVLGRIDDVLLNDLDYFRQRQPSLENLARYLFRELSRDLPEHGQDPSAIRSMQVKIWESDTAWASYAGAVGDEAGLE